MLSLDQIKPGSVGGVDILQIRESIELSGPILFEILEKNRIEIIF